MLSGGGIMLGCTSAIILSFFGYIDPLALPIGFTVSCIGVWLIIDAFFKMDKMKCKEAARHFQSKIIQSQWMKEFKKDYDLLQLAYEIPEEEIEQDFAVLMRAVKQQCAITSINEELAKEGKCPVPDVILPDEFPKHSPKRKYSGDISLIRDYSCGSSHKHHLKFINKFNFKSLPNIYVADKMEWSLPCPNSTSLKSKSNVLSNGVKHNSEENCPNEEPNACSRDLPQFVPRTYPVRCLPKGRFSHLKNTSKTLSRIFFGTPTQNSLHSLSAPNLFCKGDSEDEKLLDTVPSLTTDYMSYRHVQATLPVVSASFRPHTEYDENYYAKII